MKNKICLLILIIFLFPCMVFAKNEGENVNGSNTLSGTCKGNWCYEDASGIRISLYKYDSAGNLNQMGNSIDYATYGFNGSNNKKYGLNLKTAYSGRKDTLYISSSRKGKVTYLNSNFSPKLSKKMTLGDLSSDSLVRSKLAGMGCYYFSQQECSLDSSKIVDTIWIELGVKSKTKPFTPDSNNIVKKVNSLFNSNVTVDDLEYLYLTVEPTALIIHKATNTFYYGSAYELASFRKEKGKMYGLESVIAGNLYASIYTDDKTLSNSSKKFVGNVIKGVNESNVPSVKWVGAESGHLEYVSVPAGKSAYINPQNKFVEQTLTNSGLGIGVFWFGEYIETCKSVCASTDEESTARLACAEKFCQKKYDANHNVNKKDCIIGCGYEKPNPSKCGSGCSTPTTTSACSSSSDIPLKKTCEMLNPYTKMVCDNISTVKYSNDLPTTLLPGLGGFNYSTRVIGTRDCTISFDFKRYQFDYAVLLKSEKGTKGNDIKKNLTEYEGIKDKNNYKSSWMANIGESNVKFTVKDETYAMSVTDEKLKVDKNPTYSGASKNIYYFDSKYVSKYNYGVDAEKMYDQIKVKSSGNVLYELPLNCYSLLEGRVNNQTCRHLKKLFLYYGYYSKHKDPIVDTTTTVVNSEICLSDKNSCYYTNDDLSCSTYTKKIDDNKYEVSFEINGYKMGSSPTVKYFFGSGSEKKYERSIDPVIYVTKTTSQIVPAYIKYYLGGNLVKKTCNTYIPPKNVTPPGGNPSCKTEYGNDSVKCTYLSAIQQFCKKNWFKDTAGYLSAGDCVKDCSCEDDKVTDPEYVYRPISLGENKSNHENKYNAFPNRKAGSNWQGHEDLTLDEEFNKPKFVIILDEQAIKDIKADTKQESKSVYVTYKEGYFVRKEDFTGSDKGSYYKSRLIKANPGIFPCVNGNGICVKEGVK